MACTHGLWLYLMTSKRFKNLWGGLGRRSRTSWSYHEKTNKEGLVVATVKEPNSLDSSACRKTRMNVLISHMGSDAILAVGDAFTFNDWDIRGLGAGVLEESSRAYSNGLSMPIWVSRIWQTRTRPWWRVIWDRGSTRLRWSGSSPCQSGPWQAGGSMTCAFEPHQLAI